MQCKVLEKDQHLLAMRASLDAALVEQPNESSDSSGSSLDFRTPVSGSLVVVVLHPIIWPTRIFLPFAFCLYFFTELLSLSHSFCVCLFFFLFLYLPASGVKVPFLHTTGRQRSRIRILKRWSTQPGYTATRYVEVGKQIFLPGLINPISINYLWHRVLVHSIPL